LRDDILALSGFYTYTLAQYQCYAVTMLHTWTKLFANACFNSHKQSSGAFIAVYRYASATPLPPSILSRGIGWQVKKWLLL